MQARARRVLSIPRWALVACAAIEVACEGGSGGAPPAPSGVPGQAVTDLAPWSSQSVALAPLAADSAALREIQARVPAALPPTSASGTLIGSTAPSASASASAAAARPPELGSQIALEANLKPSNATSERDLRATFLFDLVDQCRDPGGKILPAESVLVEFRVDPKGYIERNSVRVTARAKEHEAAARCMARVIRTAEARFSPTRLDEPTDVHARVPSVD